MSLLLGNVYDDGGGGGDEYDFNVKTFNAMVTKLTHDNVGNNSSNFRCLVDMLT